MRLTSNVQELLDYTTATRENINPDLMLLAILFRFSQIANHFHLYVDAPHSTVPPVNVNMYVLAFGRSGSGKSEALSVARGLIIDDLLRDMSKQVRYGYERYVQAYIDSIPDDQLDEKGKEKKKRELFSSFLYALESDNGTYEGFLSQRIIRKKAGIGSFSLIDDEFADTLENTAQSKKDYQSGFKKAYDGNTAAKVISRDQGSYEEVQGVPVGSFAATSPDRVFAGSNYDEASKIFNRGLARRRIVCSVSDVERPEETVLEKFQRMERQSDDSFDIIGLKNISMTTFDALSKRVIVRGKVDASKNVIRVEDRDAQVLMFTYKDECENEARKLDGEHMAAERRDRWMRAIRVAALIAIIEHPEDFKVTMDDINTGIEIVEYFSKHFLAFFKEVEKPEFMKLFEHFLENKDKWLRTTDLYKGPFGRGSARSAFITRNLPDLSDFLDDHPLYEFTTKSSGRGNKYMLTERALNEDIEEFEGI